MGQLSFRCIFTCCLLSTTVFAAPVHLRTDYRENPLGIDNPATQFSWQSDNTERNWRQTAYEILVASTAQNLQSGNADVWDSGKQNSAQSVAIAYAGPALQSRKRYYWAVRVWDSKGQESQSSEPAWWEMGLLEKSDWLAKWITRTDPEAAADRAGIRWIWAKGHDALQATPKSVILFHVSIKLKEEPRDAALFVLARGDFKASVNGHQVGTKHEWHDFDREDVTNELKPGTNSIDIEVTVAEPNQLGPDAGSKTSKGALAGMLKITSASGSVRRVFTDRKWKARAQEESKWKKASVVAQLGDSRLGDVPPLPTPAALLRRSFEVAKTIASARLYVTALGSYRMFLNGQRVGDDVLTPGFTDYSKRLQYQTYDVTQQITSGKNVLGALLGEGWFASGMTWTGLPYFFQPPPVRLLAQLEIQYSDGSRDRIVSDESWTTAASPVLRSEIYSGEIYDARDEINNWDQQSFDDRAWQAATVAPDSSSPLRAQLDTPVRVVQTITPVSVTPVNGVYVYDMGQNMVGWARLNVHGPAGTRVRLRFAERLNSDGSIYTENLRNADATDIYVLRGDGEESYEPHFTFHGFRYVEVSGFPGTPTSANITGEVASSVGVDPSAHVDTASNLVNRMWSIGIWGQRGNFLSIPTDCPQRDERLGWMGDAGVFWRTGSYNFNIDAFSHKFMHDVTDGQTAEGDFTNVSPDSLRPFGSEGAPGWADAGVIIPWTTWMQYGDLAVVRHNWDAMRRFMDFIAKANPDFIRKNGVGPNFADWLAPDDRTNKDMLATAYWALVARMMEQMAHAIGKKDDARRYSDLISNIRSAFQKAYITDDGTVGTGTQTSYVVTLYAKLAPESLEAAMTEKLVKDIESRNWHLSTGFLGTPFLLFTLTDHGRSDVAYKLLLNDTYPSWGYMLSKGATTWWERWNGDTGDPSMNSYNHYAFGSVVAWVYRDLVGIDTAADGTGFQHIVIHPRTDAMMDHASGEYDSVYGNISTDWSQSPDAFTLKISIPANTTATVYLPLKANAQVWEDGSVVSAAEENGSYIVQTGAGTYAFEVK
ncbi:MAG TPA: family 78 glycoside hydrolase catalytic domain [Terriglobales bacterium]|nr:family 78 glycoside hydrolase catalytic domain [Terriglobales bacterium]